MYLTFDETIAKPAAEVYEHFKTPADWGRLFSDRDIKDLGNGWYSVGLPRFPFPLVARNEEAEPNKRVRWVFSGFWTGAGQIELESVTSTVTRIRGFESITPTGLWLAAPAAERLFMEAAFKRIWQKTWRTLRSGSGVLLA